MWSYYNSVIHMLVCVGIFIGMCQISRGGRASEAGGTQETRRGGNKEETVCYTVAL